MTDEEAADVLICVGEKLKKADINFHSLMLQGGLFKIALSEEEGKRIRNDHLSNV